MIEYKNIIELLREELPEFSIDENSLDNPIVIFSFLSGFIKDLYASNNTSLIPRIANFINDLSENDDVNIRGLLDEISIGLYDESLQVYNDFKEKLSKVAAKKFEETISMWVNANRSLDSNS